MTTPAQPPQQGKRKGVKPSTWLIIGLGVAVAGGALILWMRSRQSSAAAATTTSTSSTPTDYSGDIATLQSEIADLQSSAAQDEAGETGTSTSTAKLAAPGGFSVTPKVRAADFGWGTVAGAKAYELQVVGAGGKGTGTSHYDHAGTGNHAENVALTPGTYKARVRAGTSTTSLTGPWTPYKQFTVRKPTIGGGKPPHVTPPKKEPED